MHGKEKKFAPPFGANGSPSVSTRGRRTFGKKFVVRYEKTHGKLKGLPCFPKKMHGKLFFHVHFLFVVRLI
jgi:hypothetical protein